jgi:predicted CoA-binding protein
MATQAMIDEFLGHKKLALVRSAPTATVAGVRIEDELKPKGYDVSVVYLADSVTEPRLSTLKEPVEGVIIAVSKPYAEQAVQEAIEAKIPRVWIQNGCQSQAAIDLCEANGIPVISGACVLMYAQPVKSVHAFHRWLWKTFGLLAK